MREPERAAESRKMPPRMNSWASGSMFARRPPMNKRVDRSRSTRFGNSPTWTRNPGPRGARRRIRVPRSRTRRAEAEAEARFRPRLRTDAFRPTASGGRTGSKENRPGGKLACLRAGSRSSPSETDPNFRWRSERARGVVGRFLRTRRSGSRSKREAGLRRSSRERNPSVPSRILRS